jgi:hypothetical protein
MSEQDVKEIRIKYNALLEKVFRLQREVKHCRNELCLKCGNYHESYAGACDGCRFRHGGEWEEDLHD